VSGRSAYVRPRRAATLAVALAGYLAVLRPWLRTWGAFPDEVHGVLPGDDLVQGRHQTTRAVTVRTPPEDVWPWIVQIGHGRGGWYSYDWLERAAGAGDFVEGRSARRIVPELQALAVGETVLLSPNGGLTVASLHPARSLVLHYRMDALTAAPASAASRAVLDWTWAFALRPVPAGCRLLARIRIDPQPAWLALFLPLLELVDFGMEQKMLRTIRQRAEGSGTPPVSGEVDAPPARTP
jgi:hypothetical protein